eukprot:IDg16361t1
MEMAAQLYIQSARARAHTLAIRDAAAGACGIARPTEAQRRTHSAHSRSRLCCAEEGILYARMKQLLCATASQCGAAARGEGSRRALAAHLRINGICASWRRPPGAPLACSASFCVCSLRGEKRQYTAVVCRLSVPMHAASTRRAQARSASLAFASLPCSHPPYLHR